MKKLIRLMLCVSVAALTASCGGGDDNNNDQVFTADKYVGTWVSCRATGAATSEKEILVFARGTAINTLSFTDSTTNHFTADCSGVFGTPTNQSGSVTFDGTKVIGSETVDRVFIGNGGLGEKQVLTVRSTNPQTLATGRSSNDGGTLDSNGYPNSFDTQVFTRQ